MWFVSGSTYMSHVSYVRAILSGTGLLMLDGLASQIEKLTALTQYYGVWKPPPTVHRLHHIKHTILPKIK